MPKWRCPKCKNCYRADKGGLCPKCAIKHTHHDTTRDDCCPRCDCYHAKEDGCSVVRDNWLID
jgi:hypothetical protein